MSTTYDYSGSFSTKLVSGPAVEVDCSTWDNLGEEITYGSFETKMISGPAVVQRPTLVLTLYNSLNDLSIAKFGKGLSIKDFQQYIVAEVPAEVLS
jgi:hypothetical protein